VRYRFYIKNLDNLKKKEKLFITSLFHSRLLLYDVMIIAIIIAISSAVSAANIAP